MSSLAPENLERIVGTSDTGTLNLKGLRPCVQLAVFRLLRHKKKYSEALIDRVMTDWLITLGQARRVPVPSLTSVF